MKHKVKKVFIAGGTGFLGYKSAKLFLKMGAKVDTISLPGELDNLDWFDKRIGLTLGNLFEMSEEDIYEMLKDGGYDTFVYALGPDERITPPKPAYDFFYSKLVTECKKICSAVKRAGIKRCVIMNSYFTYFDQKYNGRLSKNHPYIRARVDQARELIELGSSGKFDVMILMLPYIFGTTEGRKPIWRDALLSHFDKFKSVMFPRGGGTAVVSAEGVAEAVVAASFNGEHAQMYPIGSTNMTYKELIGAMLEYGNDKRKYKEFPAFLCTLGVLGIKRKNKKEGKENGLDIAKLMTQIQNKKFYIDPHDTAQKLSYSELGFDGGGDILQSIKETMRVCFPERF
ncbi:MAG: NAD(P)-dependent oxidoreductase [Christensenellaceae bacterium]|jgi:nucleoside-diphosphate-sugar epimerase|nr:NAD(P)-dependent oxidoreductase [Christensenellaceae bacterium]